MGCGPGPPEEWQGGGEQRVLSEERRGEEGRGEESTWSEGVGVLIKESSSTEL